MMNQVPKGMKKSDTLMQMEAALKQYTSDIHLTEEDIYDADRKQPPRWVTAALPAAYHTVCNSAARPTSLSVNLLRLFSDRVWEAISCCHNVYRLLFISLASKTSQISYNPPRLGNVATHLPSAHFASTTQFKDIC